jgi:hypothetical protein
MTSNAARSAAWATEPRAAHVGELADMPEILYVMGTGRSGTTILEVLLTNDEGISGTGELKHIIRDGFIRDLPCACGKLGHECELWSGVLKLAGWNKEDCARYGQAIEALESHQNFARVFLGAINRKKAALHEEATTTIFRSVRRLTGSRVVVDSSKYPARALLLARMYPDKVRVLCVTRSAAGLIAAFQKKNDAEQRPKSRFAAAAYYLYVLLCMRLVRARLGKRCFTIRFEDLGRDPIGVLTRIETWSGISLARARAKIASAEWFQVGHIVTGNRLRKGGKVKFDPSSSKTPEPQRAPSSTLLSWILERYRALLGF